VVTDRDTGRSRGFGFVEMASMEEADQAIAEFNGTERLRLSATTSPRRLSRKPFRRRARRRLAPG
jgi:hypothetical protein